MYVLKCQPFSAYLLCSARGETVRLVSPRGAVTIRFQLTRCLPPSAPRWIQNEGSEGLFLSGWEQRSPRGSRFVSNILRPLGFVRRGMAFLTLRCGVTPSPTASVDTLSFIVCIPIFDFLVSQVRSPS